MADNQQDEKSNKKESVSEEKSQESKKTNILSLKETKIIDVWESNVEEELWKIMRYIETYTVIAMDTEFPGIVNKKLKPNQDDRDLEFKIIKLNVDQLKLIQIGISICDPEGNLPDNISTCADQFHIDAINLLKRAGIDFNEFKQKGIDQEKFGSLLIETGLVLNPKLTWIFFHGGFDLGYLLRILSCQPLPDTAEKFYADISYFFPNIFDIKYLIKDFQEIHNIGLSKLAQQIAVDRIGPQHQAGSDSLITLAVYFQLKEQYFRNQQEKLKKYCNIIFGLGPGYIPNMDYLQNYRIDYYEEQFEQLNQYNFKQYSQNSNQWNYLLNNKFPASNYNYRKPEQQSLQQQAYPNSSTPNQTSLLAKYNILARLNKGASSTSQENRLPIYQRNFVYNNASSEFNQDSFYHTDNNSQINNSSFQYQQSQNNLYNQQNNDNQKLYWRQYQNLNLAQPLGFQRNLSDLQSYQKNISIEEQRKNNLTPNLESQIQPGQNKNREC